VSRTGAWNAFACCLVFGVVALQFSSRAHRPDFSDFKVYWVAGAKAAEHRTVYDVHGHYQFKYSPFVALLWSLPVAHLPGTRFHWAWLHYAASAGGWFALWFVLARAIDRARAFRLWLALVLVFSIGLRDELKLGQANLLPFLLVLPAWFAADRSRPRARLDLEGLAIGAAWALAVQWKLYALVLAPLWLLRRRWWVFAGAIAMTLLTLGAALALAHGPAFALAETQRWAASLTQSSEELLVSQYNVSLLGILGKWSGGALGGWSYAVWLLVAAAWLAGLVWAERSTLARRSFWSAAWAWAGVVLLNPLVWPYWLLLCVPLFLLYLHAAVSGSLRRAGVGFWIVCALFALMNWAQNFSVVHYGGSLVAVLALMIDAWLRAQRRAPNAADGGALAVPQP
jgi:hypothetical protein